MPEAIHMPERTRVGGEEVGPISEDGGAEALGNTVGQKQSDAGMGGG